LKCQSILLVASMSQKIKIASVAATDKKRAK